MKKFSFIVAFLLPTFLCAAERSVTEAAAVASQFMNEQYAQSPVRKATCSASAFVLAHTRMKLNNEAPAFYVFNKMNQDGFVVVSGDDRTEDVLMYSETGSLDVANANPNLKFWLKHLQEEISAANDENAVDKSPARKAAMATTDIGPLLKTKSGQEITWYQEAPYSDSLPIDKYDGTRCLTGCVATAAAQILCSWRHPVHGKGSKTYVWNNYYKQSQSESMYADFEHTYYDWDNMRAGYATGTITNAQKAAVAQLMRHLGIACDMDYGGDKVGGSGAWTDDMGLGLTKYFDYTLDKFVSMYSKSAYTTAKGTSVASGLTCEWSVTAATLTNYFNADLEAGRPIIMGGEDGGGGHEFVCDGRDTRGYFHINWGWEGESNCYCKLTSLVPEGSSYDFSTHVDALIGLRPNVVDTVHVTGITVAPATLTLAQKEKQNVSAIVAPANATDKSYSWFSSNPNIASVSDAGQVTGIAEGSAFIVAQTTDGNFKDTCYVTVTDSVIETTECDPYSYTFTAKCSTGENELGAYTWNIALQDGTVQNIDSDKGQQFGSKTTPCGQVSLTTDEVNECLVKRIKVNAAIAKDGDGKLEIYIGGTKIGSTQTLTTTATDYVFVNTDELKGALEIRLTNSKRAMYIKSINTNYSDPTELESVPSIEKPSVIKCIINNQLYIIQGEQIYNAQGQLVR